VVRVRVGVLSISALTPAVGEEPLWGGRKVLRVKS
jgi:hypothetical protein